MIQRQLEASAEHIFAAGLFARQQSWQVNILNAFFI